MKYINPVFIGEQQLVFSNVAENDAPAWDMATSYTVGMSVLFNHKVYVALRNNTGKQPDLNTLDWQLVGASNRFSMFDQIVSRPTQRIDQLSVAVRVADVVNSVAFFGLKGSRLIVSMIDDLDGEVYKKEIGLVQTQQITDWARWFFEPVEFVSDVVLTDLPNYRNASLTVLIEAPGQTAMCGELVVGNIRKLGLANFGTSVSIRDYSRKEEDDFGNINIVERRFSKLADYDVSLDTKDIFRVQSSLAAVRATPVVYIGEDNSPETFVYGFYRNFRIVLEGPSLSKATIEVEGLV